MRLIIASDHPIARHGLATIAKKSHHAEVVGESPTWESLLTTVELAKPDVALLDIERPSLGWIRAVQKIHAKYPSILVACLSSTADQVYMEEMAGAGARTISISTHDEAEVLDFINRCAEQRSGSAAPRDHLRTLRLLSPRELEVLRMIAEGLKNAEIGELIGVSVRTVEFHRANIHRKTGARTTADLTRVAIESGLVSSPQRHHSISSHLPS